MVKGKLTFSRIHQDSQELGSSDEHMVSRVFFDLLVGKVLHRDLYADVKQTVGTSYETAPLEVSFPHSFKGPLNYGQFRGLVETYYRRAVGSAGMGIRVGPGAVVRMQDNIFASPWVVDIEVDEKKEPPGW
jgi:hypothetical protein